MHRWCGDPGSSGTAQGSGTDGRISAPTRVEVVDGRPGDLDAADLAEDPEARGHTMARHWRCLIGWHDWRLIPTGKHDAYSACARCGKHDWVRHLSRHVDGRHDSSNLPPGG